MKNKHKDLSFFKKWKNKVLFRNKLWTGVCCSICGRIIHLQLSPVSIPSHRVGTIIRAWVFDIANHISPSYTRPRTRTRTRIWIWSISILLNISITQNRWRIILFLISYTQKLIILPENRKISRFCRFCRPQIKNFTLVAMSISPLRLIITAFFIIQLIRPFWILNPLPRCEFET